MRSLLILFLLLPQGAWAHPGHLDTFAGHDHWVAGIALGAAVGVALWGWLKGKQEEEDEQVEAEDDIQEAEV